METLLDIFILLEMGLVGTTLLASLVYPLACLIQACLDEELRQWPPPPRHILYWGC